MTANTNLHKAKNEKNDEFYTQLTDVANELKHYISPERPCFVTVTTQHGLLSGSISI